MPILVLLPTLFNYEKTRLDHYNEVLGANVIDQNVLVNVKFNNLYEKYITRNTRDI